MLHAFGCSPPLCEGNKSQAPFCLSRDTTSLFIDGLIGKKFKLYLYMILFAKKGMKVCLSERKLRWRRSVLAYLVCLLCGAFCLIHNCHKFKNVSSPLVFFVLILYPLRLFFEEVKSLTNFERYFIVFVFFLSSFFFFSRIR